MKILKTTFFVVAILFIGAVSTHAQETKKDKKAAKEAAMKQLLNSKDFIFTAQSANPMRGGNINLTSEYDFKVGKDTLVAYLPFFGRAFVAPMDPLNGGIKFTSTKFSYVSTLKKNGYQIVMKPTDTKDVQQMVLDVSLDGYGTLHIINQDRDPMSYYGYVEANKKTKQ